LGIWRSNLKPWLIALFNILFYLFFGWEVLVILLISTLVAYSFNFLIVKAKAKAVRRFLLSVSLVFIVSTLIFFKYYLGIAELSLSLSLDNPIWYHTILLPVGMSFYIFRVISHLVDAYNQKISDKYSLISFFAYIGFFPHLVAGPLIKAQDFYADLKSAEYRPELQRVTLLFLSGFIKKLVISSYLYTYIQEPFQLPETFASIDLIFSLVIYSAYIFTDFSGYSDLANGVAMMFGIRYVDNFKGPYGSKSFAEFWRRWHISLSFWFRDYLYIPLGGDGRMSKRWKSLINYRNAFIVMLISGIWHGVGWGFVIWGGIHGLGIVLTQVCRRIGFTNLFTKIRFIQFIINAILIVITFISISALWIFFAVDNLEQVSNFYQQVLQLESRELQLVTNYILIGVVTLVILINVFYKRLSEWAYAGFGRLPIILKVAFVILGIYFISLAKPEIVPPYVYQSF
jgi:alginate O-acetyltransferase complex protein AlgI